MEIMNHITIRSQQPESVAMSVKRLLITDPSPKNADAASWRWRALGDRILPVLRDLYESPEDLPRNAALKAGGRLKDPIAIPFLIEETKQGKSLGARIEAIHLLKDMPQDPRIMFGLRPLLDSNDIEIRLQTAEALIERRDPAVQSFSIDDKFELLWLPSTHELVYVTQSGEPRIIMTGDVNIQTPLSLNTWDNHLMVKESANDDSTLDVRYHNEDSGQTFHHKISTSLPNFAMFLAHHSTPEEPTNRQQQRQEDSQANKSIVARVHRDIGNPDLQQAGITAVAEESSHRYRRKRLAIGVVCHNLVIECLTRKRNFVLRRSKLFA